MTQQQYEVLSLGDRALVVRLGDSIDTPTFRRIRSFTRNLDRLRPAGMVEYVPAFTTVTVHYDPLVRRFAEFRDEVVRCLESLDDGVQEPPREITLPVCYGGDCGPDLAEVAAFHGLTSERVVELHSGGEYLVHMLGFAPGFPYLGGMAPEIATPRHAQPRLKVPAGSVGIAGPQTGVYPMESPGGWQLIGRTPRRLFRPEEAEPTLLRAGDVVRFRPITADEFQAMCEYPR